MIKKQTKIGIWGFGRVGKAATDYFIKQGYQLEVMDNRTLTHKEQAYLKQQGIHALTQADNARFFSFNDFLFSSPGVDIRKYYQTYHNKWITELDIFQQHFHKPIIAITGTVGKTTITHMLAELLTLYGIPILVGGNIGTPTLTLINQQDACDAAVIEVSSFQLEYTKSFAPDLALITNIYPNHVDRHGSMAAYIDAKCTVFAHQHHAKHAILPFDMRDIIKTRFQERTQWTWFAAYRPSDYYLHTFHPQETLMFIENNTIIRYRHGSYTKILTLDTLPAITFQQNWLIICSALTMLELPIEPLVHFAHALTLPAHRLEKVATINHVDFYNDSKSTTPASTLAAAQKLANRPIKLLLGGLSKGIDRAPLINELKSLTKEIYCFGAEAVALHHICKQFHLPAHCFQNLKQAFAACIQTVKPGDQVLLSPAGASFDLYANFEERGEHFKELVLAYKNK